MKSLYLIEVVTKLHIVSCLHFAITDTRRELCKNDNIANKKKSKF